MVTNGHVIIDEGSINGANGTMNSGVTAAIVAVGSQVEKSMRTCSVMRSDWLP